MTARLLPEWYSDGADIRFYHNYKHASFVAETCESICNSYNLGYRTMHVLWVASMWHDAVYVPGASDNEEKSANALLALMPKETEAAALIRRTTVADHLSNEVTFESNQRLSILLDADLASIAVDSYENFVYNQECILKENGFNKNDFYLSANFLQKFLDKDTIYRSPYGVSMFEKTARRNIKRFINETTNLHLL